MREAALGPDHPDTLQSCGNLADAYLNAGRTAEAIALNEATLRAREASPEMLRAMFSYIFNPPPQIGGGLPQLALFPLAGPFSLGGVDIPAGAKVQGLFAAANREPSGEKATVIT